jgi:prolyl-tRNA synthetase
MTHEEAVVHLARSEVNSYKQLPMMLYQIQTKYRDEARPRAGLIRVREFTMKDAYSFHATKECLENYYPKIHEAYVKIFNRLGMKSVVSIESDTGMMGGKVSHEFMAVAECGEDTIFICSHCQYRANREVAITHYAEQSPSVETLKKVHTPGKTSIEEVSQFLNQSSQKTGKAVFYTGSPLQQPDKTQLVFVVIRGDLEVNETKLRNQLQLNDLKFATDEQIRSIGSVPGYASPIGIDFSKVKVVFDTSLKNQHDLIVGANEVDQHYINFSHSRDLDPALQQKIQWIDIANVKNHDPCPLCQHPLQEKRGIEVGNIFQLGTKYSESMKCNFLDQQGKSRPMIMGCYGIGVSRVSAASVEQNHDAKGIKWPIPIAPFHVTLLPLSQSEPVTRLADSLYRTMEQYGIG